MLTFKDLWLAFQSARSDGPARKSGSRGRGGGGPKNGKKWWTAKHRRVHGDKYAERRLPH